MQLGHYSYYIFWHPGDSCYFAISPGFSHLSAFGDTPEEALKEFQIILNAAIEIYQEEKWPLTEPEPPTTDDDNLPLGAVAVAGAGGTIFDDDD